MTDAQTDRHTHTQTDGRTDRQTDGRTDRQTDGRGRKDGRTEGQTEGNNVLSIVKTILILILRKFKYAYHQMHGR